MIGLELDVLEQKNKRKKQNLSHVTNLIQNNECHTNSWI